MDRKKKYTPTDSQQENINDDQTVERREGTGYDRIKTTMANPAKKRKYSEQPPTAHNTKT